MDLTSLSPYPSYKTFIFVKTFHIHSYFSEIGIWILKHICKFNEIDWSSENSGEFPSSPGIHGNTFIYMTSLPLKGNDCIIKIGAAI